MIRAVFLGVSTVLVDDGQTSLLTDGFFTRPSPLRVLTRPLRPDPARIDAALARAGITRLDAVLVAHSHYDHALDAPVVARRTGALLVGSDSTRQIALGYGFDSRRFVAAPVEAPLRVGGFTVTAVETGHSHPDRFPGTIDAPLTPPARARRFRTGECYSFHIGHSSGSLLVQASASFRPGALGHLTAHTVYLGVGQLALADETYRTAYWRETVSAVGARRVRPIHWDHFGRALDRPLRPIPRPFDNLGQTLRHLARLADADGVQLALPEPWRAEALLTTPVGD